MPSISTTIGSFNKKGGEALVKFLRKLDTPAKIQNFLDSLPFNFEEKGETYHSPREVLIHGKAHCFEGALFAAASLYYNGRKALLLDLKIDDIKEDADHVVALFKENGLWGAISKTNHAVLGWRDPIYRTVRELAVSYFHEYFLESGQKNLQDFSTAWNITAKFGTDWILADSDLDAIALALDRSKHYSVYPKSQARFIRKASPLQIKAFKETLWKPKNRKNVI